MKREASNDEITPDTKRKIEEVIKNFSTSIITLSAKNTTNFQNKSKYEIMGHIGKLLSQISAGAFDQNIDAYVGFVINTIKQEQSDNLIDTDLMKNIYEGTTKLIELKPPAVTRRVFDRILRAVDYGVYYAICKHQQS